MYQPGSTPASMVTTATGLLQHLQTMQHLQSSANTIFLARKRIKTPAALTPSSISIRRSSRTAVPHLNRRPEIVVVHSAISIRLKTRGSIKPTDNVYTARTLTPANTKKLLIPHHPRPKISSIPAPNASQCKPPLIFSLRMIAAHRSPAVTEPLQPGYFTASINPAPKSQPTPP